MTRKKACRFCGRSFAPKRANALFCAGQCRVRFHNLRKERGAMLYDLFMLSRYERDKGRLRSLMSRMAMVWREEDIAERGGRPSWQTLDEATRNIPVFDLQVGKAAMYPIRAGR